jgi:pimeloyl-ACP methyl ester carboxylesterase
MAQGAHVDIGGRKLYFEVAGAGSPTVVFESGIECGAASLANLAEAVQEFTRTVIYDRAGLGESDPAPKPRTAQDMANDLWALLTHAQIPGPYLLVGHSYGGLPLRLFATQHRAEVAGMVLLDASYPDLAQRQLALLPPPAPGEPPALTRMRNELEIERIDPYYNGEAIDLIASAGQVQASGRLGKLPLVVITAGVDEWEEGFPPELARAQEEDWQAMQQEWAALSDNSMHLIATESNHVIQDCQPELVVAVIRRLVGALQAGSVPQVGSWSWTGPGVVHVR